jgi:DNA-binding LacI/PurR family transcriptional regulator
MAQATEKRKYLELADHLRASIRNGDLQVGERLPSYVELYEKHGASTATVQRACDVLEQEQLIERRHGRGIFVASPQRTLSGTIGIIGSEGFQAEEGPFYFRIMSAVHQALDARQQHLLYLGTQHAWDASAIAKVDGVLICGVEEENPLFQILPSHLPRVSLFTQIDGVTSIGVDDYRGAQIAVRHLMKFGHRRIACLMEKQAWEAGRRIAGYSNVLQEAGIEPDPRWKRLVSAMNWKPTGQPYLDWGVEHMQAWLQDNWHEANCTAILVQNDAAAIGVLQVLQKAGIKVPEQVSIMSFDGTDYCDLVSPRLSAVAFPLAQIGTKAIEALYRQIAGEPSSAESILLPLSLRVGESVAEACS